MSITFSCPQCGKSYTTSDATAGKAARCKQCGQEMTIPRPAPPPADDIFDLGEPDLAPLTPLPAQRFTKLERPASAPGPVHVPPPSDDGKGWKQALTVLLVVVGIGLRFYFRMNRGNRRANRQPPAVQAPFLATGVNRNGPIEVPPLPDVGPGREIEPGVVFHEMHLPGGSKPGFSGKLWLYLPAGEHERGSLPCVLITGAGSTLIAGMDLAEGDRPEHLPYARAGFAVLAYEMDGAVPDPQATNEQQIVSAARKFQDARAGLVNAHIALEFLNRKVPQVDPQRVYTAGHSSAGTAALLVAEHEPSIKGCAAFAPAIDLIKRFGVGEVRKLQMIGLGDLATRYSPKSNEAKLKCPVLLFHARDDMNVPIADTEAAAARLKTLGKSVTLETVPEGGHYDSMIEEGIPRAIAWFQELGDEEGPQ